MLLSTEKALVLLLVVAMACQAFTVDSSQGNTNSDSENTDVEDLVNMANEEGDPFTQTALTALPGNQWGAKRVARTTDDVVIINASSKSFKLTVSKCALGSYSDGLLPENELKQKSSTVFGIQSSNDQEGVQCNNVYETDNAGAFFSMTIVNPFFGDNTIFPTSSWDLKVIPTLGHGHNNQIIIIVSEKYTQV